VVVGVVVEGGEAIHWANETTNDERKYVNGLPAE